MSPPVGKKESPAEVPEWMAAERLAPLGSFAMGVDFIRLGTSRSGEFERALVLANGSDWSPQAVTLHRALANGTYEPLPSWFSDDYDYHMGVAVGDLTGNGFDDLVVAVYAGKNQEFSGGGVKVYVGGPNGLSGTPIWVARGFSASSVALADLTGDGTLDIVVACLSESGTIQKPAMGPNGELLGRSRVLTNAGQDGQEGVSFRSHVLTHPRTRGCGGVSVADVDLDGCYDLIFAGQRTSVFFGKADFSKEDPLDGLEVWTSEEEHPFSFGAQAFRHPRYPEGLLVVSSRGLFTMAQTQGRTLSEIAPELLVHRPERRVETSEALQHLALFDEKRPEVPAGVTVVHDKTGFPEIVAGFLDARGRDIRGAHVRVFHGAGGDEPFHPANGQRVLGGALMAGHAKVWRHQASECVTRVTRYDVGADSDGVVTLAQMPAGDVIRVVALGTEQSSGLELPFTMSSDRGSLRLERATELPLAVSVHERTSDAFDLVVSSSAAWPPAGASQVFRCRSANADPP